MARVERGVEIDDLVELADRTSGEGRIWIRPVQIAAETEARFQPPSFRFFHAGQRVEPRRFRQRQTILALQLLQNRVLELGRHSHAADPLHVGVAADGEQPSMRFANHSPHQGQVGDGLHVLHPVGVVRDPHRPAKDSCLGGGIQFGNLVDLRLPHAGLLVDLAPGRFADLRQPLFVPVGVGFQKRFVLGSHLVNPLGDTGKERQIAADVRLDVERGDFGAEEEGPRVAGDAEADEAGLDDRVDGDDMSPTAADVFQRRHQARMVAGGIAADDKDEVRVLHILQRQRRRAAADGSLQADTARLVAIEAAIVDVVGPVLRPLKYQNVSFGVTVFSLPTIRLVAFSQLIGR
ncbi:MAG: hypothetical protein K8R36_07010 [Planctomycetales bacterium]|nr:hypothetical protein [Planctomycetales bacterium]